MTETTDLNQADLEPGAEASSKELKTEAKKSTDITAAAELEAKVKELESFKEKYFYLAAEMENSRKRFEREKENLIKFGNEKVLSGLVEVIDNLDRTLTAIKDDQDEKVKSIHIGVDMVKKQMMDTLKANGLERVEALGKIFDPNFHEALAQQPAPESEDQEIIQVFQDGYLLNGRLLRAAKVIVAKND